VSELFSPDSLFHNAILGGLGVALLCSMLGVYLMLRRLVLIGVALPQASAAGIAAVFWLTGHGHGGGGGTHGLALAGSLGATFGALTLLIAGRRRAGQPAEWSVGALYAISAAATILFVALNPKGDIEMAGLLRGELLALTAADLRLIAIVLVAVGALFVAFRRDLLLASFDPEFARTIGRSPLRYDALLYFLIGGSIAVGVMTAGPLVVFGFLVLPALAALRIAPSLAIAFAISAAVAATSFLGGFQLAYSADLPAGPVCVAMAAAFWLVIAAIAHLRPHRRAAGLALLLAVLAVPLGCADLHARAAARNAAPLPRGTLPDLAGRTVVVLPAANATGQPLHVPSNLFWKDLPHAIGDPFAASAPTVPMLLQQRASAELARRGIAVAPPAAVLDALPHPPDEPLAAARAAALAGFPGPVLTGRLSRFTVTNDGLLLVRLELWLIDPASEKVIWSGAARRPVAVNAALTAQEVLLDAGGPIFAEAFGAL